MDSKLITIHFFLFSRRKRISAINKITVFFCFLFK